MDTTVYLNHNIISVICQYVYKKMETAMEQIPAPLILFSDNRWQQKIP